MNDNSHLIKSIVNNRWSYTDKPADFLRRR